MKTKLAAAIDSACSGDRTAFGAFRKEQRDLTQALAFEIGAAMFDSEDQRQLHIEAVMHLLEELTDY